MDRWIDKQIDREIDREIDKEIDREIDSEIDGEMSPQSSDREYLDRQGNRNDEKQIGLLLKRAFQGCFRVGAG